jgi:hypothetical protein
MTPGRELDAGSRRARPRTFGRIAVIAGLLALGASTWWFQEGSTSLTTANRAYRTAQRELKNSRIERTNARYELSNAKTNAGMAAESARAILDKGVIERDNAAREADISRQMIAAAIAENGSRYNSLRDQVNQLVDETNVLVKQVNELLDQHPEFAPTSTTSGSTA